MIDSNIRDTKQGALLVRQLEAGGNPHMTHALNMNAHTSIPILVR